MDLKETAKDIFENNVQKGFWNDRVSIPQKMRESALFSESDVVFVEKAIRAQMLMLIVSELSEAMESDRADDKPPITDQTRKAVENRDGEDFKQAFETRIKNSYNDELADAIIRLLDVSFGSGIDIEWHIAQKIRYNKMRPHMHGKKY